MKHSLFTLFLLLTTACTREMQTIIRFDVQDYDGTNPQVIVGWDSSSVPIDSVTGKGMQTLNLQAPTYALIEVRKHDRRLCFLEPGKDLTLTYSQKKGEKQVIYGGKLGKETEFLHQGNYSFIPINSKDTNIKKTIQKIDSVLALNLRKVEDIPFSKTFKAWETKRQKVESFVALLRFPSYSLIRDTNVVERMVYLAELRNRLALDSTYLSIPAYREALEQYVRRLVYFKQVNEDAQTEARLECIFENITEPSTLAYMVDRTLFHILGNAKYEKLYRQYVRDSTRLALYNEACKKMDRIAPGQLCPDFRFQDNYGETISLADLKGKFVYIDMWATWCGPCKGEMPSLLKLEKEFAGKDILFMSLSIDRNKDIELWKKTIAEMNLEGIQLHLGENWDWLKIFMPSSLSVPRFVLLDRDGKIIDANMSRPSDKTTAERFNQLLNL